MNISLSTSSYCSILILLVVLVSVFVDVESFIISSSSSSLSSSSSIRRTIVTSRLLSTSSQRQQTKNIIKQSYHSKWHDDKSWIDTLHTTTLTSTTSSTTKLSLSSSSVQRNSEQQKTIVVIGGTSGIGQLVCQKLASTYDYRIRATTRNVKKGNEILLNTDNNGNQMIDVVSLNLVPSELTIEEQLKQIIDNTVEYVIITVGTTAFPTKKWWGGNTPKAIDEIAVSKIINYLSTRNKHIKKVILVTSIGVSRTNTMPFLILNSFGVLDCKRYGEDLLKTSGLNYVIIRPGRLIGGPFTNDDIAKLLQIQGGSENGVIMEVGDTLLGDCKRDACSEAIIQCLLNNECTNVDFSIISNDTISSFTNEQWNSEFNRLTASSSSSKQEQQPSTMYYASKTTIEL